MKLNESAVANANKNSKMVKDNPWAGTILQTYALVDPKSKGGYGEDLVKEQIKEVYKIPIEKRTNPGHDAIIGGYKTEIKFSAATKRNMEYKFTFNHIGIGKDWERIIFMGVNGDLDAKIVWFTKEDILQILKTSTCLSHQQGGKSSDNDDYISANKNSQILMNHPLAKTMEQWS